MTQNIYDNDGFFEAYSHLERSTQGLDGAPEWPALRALLPTIRDLRVLDLGCGYGWFCRWARQQGAASVLGIDVSSKMLRRAQTEPADAGLTYRQADLEDVDLPMSAFELVYSSLAFHYLTHLDTLVARIHRALAPGGRLIFSVEHPIATASHAPDWLDHGTGQVWPVDHYLEEGPRVTDWLAKGVRKEHRMLGTYLNMLTGAGFSVSHVEDWGPSAAQVAARPEWTRERERPLFLLIAANR